MGTNIIVAIQGGVASPVGNIPDGFELVIRNYDIDGTELNLKTDENNQQYDENRYFTISEFCFSSSQGNYPKVN